MKLRVALAQLALAGGVAALAGAVGLAPWRLEVARLSRQVERLERSNASLAGNAERLAEALRTSRAPLEARLHELEQKLAGRAPPPAAASSRSRPAPAAPARVARSPARPAPKPEPRAPARPSPRRSGPSAPPSAPALAPEPAPVPAARVAEAVRSREIPAVSAGPRARTRDAEECRVLWEPAFRARLGEPDPVMRFRGRLALWLSGERDHPSLAVAGDALSPYALDELPLHVSFGCGGVDYLVSVCSLRQGEARGVIAPAEGWSRPCGAEDDAP